MFGLEKISWVILLITLISVFLINISMGSVSIPHSEIIKVLIGESPSNPIWKDIIINFRLTKGLTCVLAGGGLALGGLQMQTLFRNPLAGPDVLGLTAGASLAVALLIMGTYHIQLPFKAWGLAMAASIGSAGVFVLILAFSRKLRDSASLLIIGLMIGAGSSSIISVLQYISSAQELQAYIIWSFGNVGGTSWQETMILLVIFVSGTTLALAYIKPLNAWLLGENYAKSLGINLKSSRSVILLSTSLLTGGITAFCGPIVFVGIAVPHLIKMLVKTSNHKILVPMVVIGGAILLLLCDTLSQVMGDTQVLPLNAITSLFGAPVVIWVVLRNRVVK